MYHPDNRQTGSKEKFQLLTEAYTYFNDLMQKHKLNSNRNGSNQHQYSKKHSGGKPRFVIASIHNLKSLRKANYPKYKLEKIKWILRKMYFIESESDFANRFNQVFRLSIKQTRQEQERDQDYQNMDSNHSNSNTKDNKNENENKYDSYAGGDAAPNVDGNLEVWRSKEFRVHFRKAYKQKLQLELAQKWMHTQVKTQRHSTDYSNNNTDKHYNHYNHSSTGKSNVHFNTGLSSPKITQSILIFGYKFSMIDYMIVIGILSTLSYTLYYKYKSKNKNYEF